MGPSFPIGRGSFSGHESQRAWTFSPQTLGAARGGVRDGPRDLCWESRFLGDLSSQTPQLLGESVCFLPTPTPSPTDSEAGDTNTGACTHVHTHTHTHTPLGCGSGGPAASILEPHLDESKSQNLGRANIDVLEEKPGSRAGQAGVRAHPGLSAWSSEFFWKGGERAPRPRVTVVSRI